MTVLAQIAHAVNEEALISKLSTAKTLATQRLTDDLESMQYVEPEAAGFERRAGRY